MSNSPNFMPPSKTTGCDISKCKLCPRKNNCGKYMIHLMETANSGNVAQNLTPIAQYLVLLNEKVDALMSQQTPQVQQRVQQQMQQSQQAQSAPPPQTQPVQHAPQQAQQETPVSQQFVQPVQPVQFAQPTQEFVPAQPVRPQPVFEAPQMIRPNVQYVPPEQEPIMQETQVLDNATTGTGLAHYNPSLSRPEVIVGEDGKVYKKKTSIFGNEKYKEVK